ncbi:hypothetical protein [Kitasatospora aureofaciens]|uniref:hypothetical protein n=1 Tax=Kitasatospora aureofaciens TaxID=1894 RepID=UPI0036F49559
MARPLSRERFAARPHDLRGRHRDTHPFHPRPHSGGCTPPELRRCTWELVLDHCVTEAQQQAAVDAPAFTCEVLRAVPDAVDDGTDR